jgi:hypothetical protein
MKRFLLAVTAAAALSTFWAGAAMASDVTGTVTVNGSVAAKCNVSGPFTATLELGELAQSNGTVVNTFGGTTSVDFSVQCTDANPTLTISATPLVYSAGVVVSGYTNTVHYTATVTGQKAPSGSTAVAYTTANALPAASTSPLGAPLKNAPSNINVTISGPHTTTATDLLDASPTDGYVGTVTVTLSPT